MSEGFETMKDPKDWEESRKSKLDAVLKMLTDLTDEERLEVRRRLMENHCEDCWRYEAPNERCYCSSDFFPIHD